MAETYKVLRLQSPDDPLCIRCNTPMLLLSEEPQYSGYTFAMWFPTQDEAVELYARFLAARHGSAAERHARRTAERLQAEGDHAGHAIWSRVADVVEQSKAKEPRRALA